ncbi:MAG: hypothetical protein ACJAT2_002217 [Bacteriovoracaceae bacterium]|jgi:hypothetical protein
MLVALFILNTSYAIEIDKLKWPSSTIKTSKEYKVLKSKFVKLNGIKIRLARYDKKGIYLVRSFQENQYNGLIIPDGSEIRVYKNGTPASINLSKDTKFKSLIISKQSPVKFRKNGILQFSVIKSNSFFGKIKFKGGDIFSLLNQNIVNPSYKKYTDMDFRKVKGVTWNEDKHNDIQITQFTLIEPHAFGGVRLSSDSMVTIDGNANTFSPVTVDNEGDFFIGSKKVSGFYGQLYFCKAKEKITLLGGIRYSDEEKAKEFFLENYFEKSKPCNKVKYKKLLTKFK